MARKRKPKLLIKRGEEVAPLKDVFARYVDHVIVSLELSDADCSTLSIVQCWQNFLAIEGWSPTAIQLTVLARWTTDKILADAFWEALLS